MHEEFAKAFPLYAKVYTYLVNFEADEYTVKVAKTIKEDEELLKKGFEYVTEEKE